MASDFSDGVTCQGVALQLVMVLTHVHPLPLLGSLKKWDENLQEYMARGLAHAFFQML